MLLYRNYPEEPQARCDMPDIQHITGSPTSSTRPNGAVTTMSGPLTLSRACPVRLSGRPFWFASPVVFPYAVTWDRARHAVLQFSPGCENQIVVPLERSANVAFPDRHLSPCSPSPIEGFAVI